MSKNKPLMVVAQATTVLTPEQKKFNTLMQRIAKQRDVLREWEQVIDVSRHRHASEALPLVQVQLACKLELLRLFDRLAEQKLAKADRIYLQELICSDASLLLEEMEEPPEAELKAIYQRHAGTDYDADQQVAQQEFDVHARVMVEEIFGVTMEDGESITPDAVIRRLAQQAQEQKHAQAAAEAAAPRSRSRKPSAAAQKKEEQAKLASQSVREVFRKLVSSLHPDRESDPVERERKNALMQRVNMAYEAGNLLQLLELQLEVEQIDDAHLAGLSEERLSHYNRVLKTQLEELKQEVAMREAEMAYELGGSPYERYTPKKIGLLVEQEIASLHSENLALQQLLQRLQSNPSGLKSWLKEERAWQRKQERMLEDGVGFFF